MSYLNYKEIGEGPPIIIAHGLLGMLDNWRTFSKRLAERGYKVISIDQRNHGKSFHSDDFDYELLATDLKKFIDELGLDKVHLMGHSMGGRMAMQFLSMFPERLDKTIVVDMSPAGSIGSHDHIFQSLLSVDFSSVSSRKEVEQHLSSRGLPMAVVYFLLKNLKRDAGAGRYAWKANVRGLHTNYDKIVQGLDSDQVSDKPILFAGGSESGYITSADMKVIIKMYPEYCYETIQGAGHWVHADNPDQLLEAVTQFLASQAHS